MNTHPEGAVRTWRKIISNEGNCTNIFVGRGYRFQWWITAFLVIYKGACAMILVVLLIKCIFRGKSCQAIARRWNKVYGYWSKKLEKSPFSTGHRRYEVCLWMCKLSAHVDALPFPSSTGRQKRGRRYALKYYKKKGQSPKGDVTLDPSCIAQECSRQEEQVAYEQHSHKCKTKKKS